MILEVEEAKKNFIDVETKNLQEAIETLFEIYKIAEKYLSESDATTIKKELDEAKNQLTLINEEVSIVKCSAVDFEESVNKIEDLNIAFKKLEIPYTVIQLLQDSKNSIWDYLDADYPEKAVATAYKVAINDDAKSLKIKTTLINLFADLNIKIKKDSHNTEKFLASSKRKLQNIQTLINDIKTTATPLPALVTSATELEKYYTIVHAKYIEINSILKSNRLFYLPDILNQTLELNAEICKIQIPDLLTRYILDKKEEAFKLEKEVNHNDLKAAADREFKLKINALSGEIAKEIQSVQNVKNYIAASDIADKETFLKYVTDYITNLLKLRDRVKNLKEAQICEQNAKDFATFEKEFKAIDLPAIVLDAVEKINDILITKVEVSSAYSSSAVDEDKFYAEIKQNFF